MQTQGKHVNSTQKGPNQESNQEPSHCNVTMLTTTPLWTLYKDTEDLKSFLIILSGYIFWTSNHQFLFLEIYLQNPFPNIVYHCVRQSVSQSAKAICWCDIISSPYICQIHLETFNSLTHAHRKANKFYLKVILRDRASTLVILVFQHKNIWTYEVFDSETYSRCLMFHLLPLHNSNEVSDMKNCMSETVKEKLLEPAGLPILLYTILLFQKGTSD